MAFWMEAQAKIPVQEHSLVTELIQWGHVADSQGNGKGPWGLVRSLSCETPRWQETGLALLSTACDTVQVWNKISANNH